MVSESSSLITSSYNTANISTNHVMKEDTAILMDSKKVLEEAFATLMIPSSSSSSSCYSSCSAPAADHRRHRGDHGGEDDEEEAAVESKDARRDHEDEGDDGYHTPTSPRHRIPAALTCPPAPVVRKNIIFLNEERGDEVDSDDEGYHTPTSPRQRIPAPLECPAAPAGRPRPEPCRKRKDMEESFGKMCDFSMEVEELRQSRKIAKRDC